MFDIDVSSHTLTSARVFLNNEVLQWWKDTAREVQVERIGDRREYG